MSKSQNRVTELVKKVRHIEDEARKKTDGAAKYITDRCNTIATEEHKRLKIIVDPKTGEITSKPAVKYRYYARLMEGYRAGIKALNFKHHNIERNVRAFINKFSDSVEGLEDKLDPELDIQTLRDNLIVLRANSHEGSEFRNELKKLRIEHHAFYAFSTKASIKGWIRDDSKEKLNEKLHSEIIINPEWIKKLCEQLLTKKSPDRSDLFVGIALATGRRLTEVMKTAKFKKLDESSLLFSGQLKTKNRHLFEDVSGYEIPCLVNADLVVKALSLLRKDTGKDELKYKNALGEEVVSTVKAGDIKDYLHNEAIKQKYASTMNRAVHVRLGNSNINAHDCRAIYTELTYPIHKTEGERPPAYRHRVLGHSFIETQLHYDRFKLDSSVKTIEVTGGDEEAPAEIKDALLAHLKAQDNEVNSYIRAPKMAVMHKWLKSQIEGGLPYDQVTGAYIRKHCLFEGKQINLNTAKKYLTEFAKWDEFQPPKTKKPVPENEDEKQLLELREQLETEQERVEEIEEERARLESELAELKERIEEIEVEDEELEEELEEKQEANYDLERLIEELEEKIKYEKAKGDEAVQWPPVETLKINASKEGKGYKVWAVVDDNVIELWAAGGKVKAIEYFKQYYKKEYLSKA